MTQVNERLTIKEFGELVRNKNHDTILDLCLKLRQYDSIGYTDRSLKKAFYRLLNGGYCRWELVKAVCQELQIPKELIPEEYLPEEEYDWRFSPTLADFQAVSREYVEKLRLLKVDACNGLGTEKQKTIACRRFESVIRLVRFTTALMTELYARQGVYSFRPNKPKKTNNSTGD